jgi:23S rRNA (guanosine2251-2'-O)-methyltransferase
MVFGIHAVEEAIKAGKELNKVLVNRQLRGEGLLEIKRECRQRGIPVQEVPAEKLNGITKANHQGVIAFIAAAEYMPLEEVVSSLFEQGQNPLLLILDRLTDVRNFGAIARSAWAAGAHAIVIPAFNSVQITADAMKTSAGALNHLPVCRVSSLDKALDYLKNSGIHVVAATEKAVSPYFNEDFTGPLALLLGAEDEGIHPDLLRKADVLARIPMPGKLDSLNVSVSAGILLFEVVRQRFQE